jgi:hypothetical protein
MKLARIGIVSFFFFKLVVGQVLMLDVCSGCLGEEGK